VPEPTSANPPRPLPVPDEIQWIVDALDDKRAKDIAVLHLEEVSDSLDWFVLATGESSLQLQALEDGIRERLKAAGVPLKAVEGPSSRWVLMGLRLRGGAPHESRGARVLRPGGAVGGRSTRGGDAALTTPAPHWAEGLARRALERLGWTTLAANARTRSGEIDLVMADGATLVFVEVRQRSRAAHGGAAESLDVRKRLRVRRAAALWLAREGHHEASVRFDAVLVDGGSRDPTRPPGARRLLRDGAPLPRIAIIDVGSNTAKLIALEYQPGRSWRQLDELRSVVRLSSGLVDGGALLPKPFARGLAALRTFASYAAAVGVDHVVATATSAVRDATNGAAFVAAARQLGVELRVLDGEEEARVGALAVANGLDVRESVTFDLGGGSFQLAELRERRWHRGRSWPLGAVVAHERYLRGDPPKPKSVKALRLAARTAVERWHGGAPSGVFVALGGTVRNLANVHQKRIGYPLDLLHGYRLPAAALAELADDLVSLAADRRAELPGLNRDRADIIAAGAVVVAEVVGRRRCRRGGDLRARACARGCSTPTCSRTHPIICSTTCVPSRSSTSCASTTTTPPTTVTSGRWRSSCSTACDRGIPTTRRSGSSSAMPPPSTTSGWRSTTTATSITGWP
jgi:ribosome silencing factor RsfS/YbeB/iojap